MEDRFFTLRKFERRMRELEEFRFVDMRSIFPMQSKKDTAPSGTVHGSVPECVNEKAMSEGDLFIGRDGYLWLRKTVRIPNARQSCKSVGRFDFGKTGDGGNSGFESLLFVNRHPYQGVDTNHGEVVFQNIAGQEAELTFLLWTGLEGGGPKKQQECKLRQAQIGYLHEDTDNFYYLAKAITKSFAYMPENDPHRYRLIAALDEALLLINWDVDKFYLTVGQAYKHLNEQLEKTKKNSLVTINCVGHTHIDVAWLWRLNHTREKVMRSFSTVLHLMDEFEEYQFLQTQPQLYRYLKHDCPELYEKIRQKVQEGKWEPDGGMWLEADCNISSGESLVRQFLHGIRFFQSEFGKSCTYLWLPDVFGYSWALPQIMKQCGIRTFVTTKISWNQFNSMPDDLFTWRGIDGSEILTYFITTPEIGHSLKERSCSYNGMMSPRCVFGAWEKFHNKDLSDEVLVSYGYGDGGGGVNRNMLQMQRAMDRLPGLPNVKPSKAGDFFNRLHEKVEQTDRYVHTWDGELYLEYHRGTYTSQARNKKWNRRMEFELAEAEWLSSLSCIKNHPYDAQLLHDAWEIILRNQFHDIIPGSSIHEVYEDSEREYQEALVKTQTAQNNALRTLLSHADNTYTLYHFGSFSRTECVFIPQTASGVFQAENGSLLPMQKTKNGYYVLTALEPLAFRTIRFLPNREAPKEISPFCVDLLNRRVITPHYRISWDESGFLTEVFDRTNEREILAAGGRGNLFEIFEDKPLDFDNWDIDIFYMQKKELARLSCEPELVDNGPLRLVLRFQYVYNRSAVTQDLVLYSENRRMDFVTSVDWQESHRLLKVAFETGIRSTHAAYDIQFGYAERPTHFNTSWDYARFEVVGHKWADLSEANYGISLLNDCKYGYSIKDGIMKLSLLKSGKYPDTEADMGTHTFTYSLLPHAAGNISESSTVEAATALNLPIHVVLGRADDCRAVRMDRQVLSVDVVKQSENGDCMVVRLHECMGGTQRVTLTSDLPVCRIEECNLLEEVTGKEYAPDTWTATWKPFEIKTFRLIL